MTAFFHPRMIASLFWLLLLSGCSVQPSSTSSSSATPSALATTGVAGASPTGLAKEQAVSKATGAFKIFAEELKSELQKALADGGPVNAVKVCRDVAPQLAIRTAEREGFAMGRSSHRLRNSGNAPSEAVAGYLKKYAQAGEKAPVEATEENGLWVVVAPIVTQPLCLTCHGDPTTMPPELKKALSENYPDDQATGFAAGDLRGVFWARL